MREPGEARRRTSRANPAGEKFFCFLRNSYK